MRIAVLGANGRTGRAFVNTAIRAGHDIRAGVHSGGFRFSEGVVVVPCDATNPVDVANLTQGCDAVVSLIGHRHRSPSSLQTISTDNIIQAMEKQGIKRLISLTGTGVRCAGDRITLSDRILNTSIRLIDPQRVVDGIEHAELIKKSDVDWTVLRVLKLQNGRQRPYILRPNGPTKLFVSRLEVADALMTILEQGSFIKQSPIISPV